MEKPNSTGMYSGSGFPKNFLDAATGPVTIRMSNDYLFRALLQRSNYVLKGLICSLLHLDEGEVEAVEITNPIKLGDAIDEKTYYLDISVVLNGNVLINLEMQVVNYHDWPERSLVYLCRTFDSLQRGEHYADIKSAMHISLLNFSLFPEYPEFYATYQFLNVKNHTVYSDKLRLSVVDLTHTDLATEEDRLYHIDKWASLFRAATWEEIKMLAQSNDYIREASNTVYQLSHEDEVRLQCEAREDYYRLQRSKDLEVERAKAERDAAVTERDVAVAERDAAVADRNSVVAERDFAVAALAEKDAVLAKKDAALAELQAEIARLKGC